MPTSPVRTNHREVKNHSADTPPVGPAAKPKKRSSPSKPPPVSVSASRRCRRWSITRQATPRLRFSGPTPPPSRSPNVAAHPALGAVVEIVLVRKKTGVQADLAGPCPPNQRVSKSKAWPERGRMRQQTGASEPELVAPDLHEASLGGQHVGRHRRERLRRQGHRPTFANGDPARAAFIGCAPLHQVGTGADRNPSWPAPIGPYFGQQPTRRTPINEVLRIRFGRQNQGRGARLGFGEDQRRQRPVGPSARWDA